MAIKIHPLCPGMTDQVGQDNPPPQTISEAGLDTDALPETLPSWEDSESRRTRNLQVSQGDSWSLRERSVTADGLNSARKQAETHRHGGGHMAENEEPSCKCAHLCVTFSRPPQSQIFCWDINTPGGPSAGGLLPCASVSLFVKNVSNPSLVKQGCF